MHDQYSGAEIVALASPLKRRAIARICTNYIHLIEVRIYIQAKIKKKSVLIFKDAVTHELKLTQDRTEAHTELVIAQDIV